MSLPVDAMLLVIFVGLFYTLRNGLKKIFCTLSRAFHEIIKIIYVKSYGRKPQVKGQPFAPNQKRKASESS